jgi:hypothetical protein
MLFSMVEEEIQEIAGGKQDLDHRMQIEIPHLSRLA